MNLTYEQLFIKILRYNSSSLKKIKLKLKYSSYFNLSLQRATNII